MRCGGVAMTVTLQCRQRHDEHRRTGYAGTKCMSKVKSICVPISFCGSLVLVEHRAHLAHMQHNMLKHLRNAQTSNKQLKRVKLQHDGKWEWQHCAALRCVSVCSYNANKKGRDENKQMTKKWMRKKELSWMSCKQQTSNSAACIAIRKSHAYLFSCCTATCISAQGSQEPLSAVAASPARRCRLFN